MTTEANHDELHLYTIKVGPPATTRTIYVAATCPASARAFVSDELLNEGEVILKTTGTSEPIVVATPWAYPLEDDDLDLQITLD